MILTAEQNAKLQASTDLHKFDLNISNTIPAASVASVQIELFNYLFSNTVVTNPACNNFQPIQVGGTPVVVATANTANQYVNAYLMGGVDTFISANGQGTRLPAGATNSYLFFAANGALTYQPGYTAGGAQIAGALTVQAKQTNYNHVFRTLGNAAIYLRSIKVTVAPTYASAQLTNDFKFVSQNITSSSGSNNQGASTYSNEYQQQSNIVTVPVNQAIDPNSGLWYTINGYDGANAMTVGLTIFFVPMTKSML